MAAEFQTPDFSQGQLEIRIDEEGVAIYGTAIGLTALANICTRLAERSLEPGQAEHVHLEDQGLLTAHSVNAAVARYGF